MIKAPKITIRQNRWDNWYGYVSGRRMVAFMNTTPHKSDAGECAIEWKRLMDAGYPQEALKIGLLTVTRK
jgi:hypothetical protein